MDLREYLFRNNITITEFSELLEYSRNYISLVALGRAVPSAKLARQIEKATNGEVTVHDLCHPKEMPKKRKKSG